MKTRAILIGALLTLGAGKAWSADVKLTGVLYAQYGVYASSTTSGGTYSKGRGEFSVSRIYMNAEAKFSPKVKGKIVLEANTAGQSATVTSSTSTVTVTATVPNNVFLKNAFLEYVDLYPGANATFGFIGTAWISFEESIWGRRFVSKVYADQEGIVPSADKGVGLVGKIPKGYGSYHLVYANGEGTTSNEKSGRDGRIKDTLLRVSVAPLPNVALLEGLQVHGYLQDGRAQFGQARRRGRLFYALSYQHSKFHVMAGRFTASTGNGTKNVDTQGTSVHGSVKLPKNFSLFARQDRHDADKDKANDIRVRTLVGVDYKLAEGARISLNNQSVAQEKLAATQRNENQWLAQAELKF